MFERNNWGMVARNPLLFYQQQLGTRNSMALLVSVS